MSALNVFSNTILATLLISLAFGGTTLFGSSSYRITQIGSGSFDPSFFGEGDLALNNAGDVVGVIEHDPENAVNDRAYIWNEEDGLTELGTFGGTWSRALSINDSRQVTGYSELPAGNYHAFLWSPLGGMVDLGTLGSPASRGTDINALGEIVGIDHLDSGRAFRWSPSTGMESLGTLGRPASSRALAINDKGLVVGWSEPVNLPRHAFVWSEVHGMRDIAPFPRAYSEAVDINNHGLIVGRAPRDEAFPDHPYPVRWAPDGSITVLSTNLGWCTAINNHGTIVGFDQLEGAFVWDDTNGFQYLTPLVTSNGGGVIVRADAINDKGQIAAWLFDDGRYHAVLLTPIELDADRDGVPDTRDQCPNTPLGTVVNVRGCSIAQLCPCEGDWRNHGEYVRCVIQHAWEFYRAGLIGDDQRKNVVAMAARSDCGRRAGTPEPNLMHCCPQTREECQREGVRVVVAGEAVGRCMIEVSSDLIHWSPLTGEAIVGDEIALPISSAVQGRFYRARVSP